MKKIQNKEKENLLQWLNEGMMFSAEYMHLCHVLFMSSGMEIAYLNALVNLLFYYRQSSSVTVFCLFK